MNRHLRRRAVKLERVARRRDERLRRELDAVVASVAGLPQDEQERVVSRALRAKLKEAGL